MKIVFFGSDDFAQRHLEALVTSHNVLACVTQPDKPKGRGMKVVESPIKITAQKNKIPVLQPTVLTEQSFIDTLKKYNADLFVVIAYGRILPSAVLKIPKLFPLNVHGSLLPRYRGAAPINWAIMNGDKKTGITIMKLNEQMDAGDIIEQMTLDIAPIDDAQMLREKMMQAGPTFLLTTLEKIAANRYQPKKQDMKEVTLAPKLTKELGKIDWNKSAVEIHNLVRGLIPWPTAYTTIIELPLNKQNSKTLAIVDDPGESFRVREGKLNKEKTLKILLSQVVSHKATTPGQIIALSKEGILVSCRDQALLAQRVQPQDGKPMDAHAFVIGHKLKIGDSLG